ncbi:MAG TPA: hypothetical protein VFS39_07480 [Nitrospira sp.]|nr:hypothetical protein [Nitrospira sp.]
MAPERLHIRAALIIGLALAVLGCRSDASLPRQTITVSNSWSALAVPPDVHRIAVFYPQSSLRDHVEAYHQLEGAAFQLKAARPVLALVDRFNIQTVAKELRFQNGGAVSEETAMRIGHLLGVDSVLLFMIDGPTLTDRIMSTRLSRVRPVTITTKIIRVESAEVVYLDVVTARMEDYGYGDRWLFDSGDYDVLSREALDRSIKQTVADLQSAFR